MHPTLMQYFGNRNLFSFSFLKTANAPVDEVPRTMSINKPEQGTKKQDACESHGSVTVSVQTVAGLL